MSFQLRLLALFAITLLVVFVWLIGGLPREAAVPVAAVPTIPPYTPEIAAQLEKSKGFQHLVSYSDGGFTPAVLSVKKGDTVRFTNNSSRDLWVASSASENNRLYPLGTSATCGQSALDSCVSMKPLEFWEFTFDAVGEWSYRNNISSGDLALIRVR